MQRYRIHGSIHAHPGPSARHSVALVNGREVPVLEVTPAMANQPMALSFEEASARLERLPRMFLEPDGSFVWVAPAEDPAWQLDGVLFDREGHLLFVNVRGELTADALSQLIDALTAGQHPVIFQLAREAVFLDEDEFRRSCGF